MLYSWAFISQNTYFCFLMLFYHIFTTFIVIYRLLIVFLNFFIYCRSFFLNFRFQRKFLHFIIIEGFQLLTRYTWLKISMPQLTWKLNQVKQNNQVLLSNLTNNSDHLSFNLLPHATSLVDAVHVPFVKLNNTRFRHF